MIVRYYDLLALDNSFSTQKKQQPEPIQTDTEQSTDPNKLV